VSIHALTVITVGLGIKKDSWPVKNTSLDVTNYIQRSPKKRLGFAS